MSREIKFRAWDGKRLYVVRSLHNLHSQVNVHADLCDDDGGFGTDKPAVTTKHELQLMQYTGLHDKNGVEIYEGDILGERPYGYFRQDGIKDGRYRGREWVCFAVEWGEYDAGEAGLVSGYEYETDGKYAGWNIVVGGYDDETKSNEVIGNIYENPELLKESK